MRLINQRLTLEEARRLMGGRPARRALRWEPATEFIKPDVRRGLLGVDVEIDLPIEVFSINELNRWKWSRKKHRKAVFEVASALLYVRKPAAVGLIRFSPGKFDHDNLEPSFKFIRDAIAAVYKRDDADWKPGAISWTYNQVVRGRLYGVRIAVVGDLF